jgi:hypothetical protein
MHGADSGDQASGGWLLSYHRVISRIEYASVRFYLGNQINTPLKQRAMRADALAVTLGGVPYRLPVLAVATVLRARSDLQPVGRHEVGVAAARAASTTVVQAQLDLAQWTVRFDYRGDGALRF